MAKETKKITDFTKKNTIEIVELIQQKRLRGRNLYRKERLRVVAFLRNEGKSQYEIARMLGVCDKTVWLDCKTLKKNAAQLVKQISVDRLAGDLIREAEILVSKAKRDKGYGLAWRIKCELIDKLQSLGYIYKAPEELKHSGEVRAELFFENLVKKAGLDAATDRKVSNVGDRN